MEELDTQKLARVWSRVKGTGGRDDLQQMLELSRAAAAHCGILARKNNTKRRVLQQIAQQNKAAAESLLGICSLSGCPYISPAFKYPAKPLRQQLLDCYTRQQQLCSLYTAHASDPQFGQIYSRLGQQAADHCHLFLQLLGITA